MEMDGAPKKVGQLIKVPAGLPLIRVTNTLTPLPPQAQSPCPCGQPTNLWQLGNKTMQK